MVSLVTDFYMLPYLHISTDLKLDLQLDPSDIAAELFLAVLHLTPEHITVVAMQLQQTDCPQGYCSFYSMQLPLYTSETAFSRAVHTSGLWPRATTGGVCCTCDSCSGCECEQVHRCTAELLLIIDHPLCQQPEGCHMHIPNLTVT